MSLHQVLARVDSGKKVQDDGQPAILGVPLARDFAGHNSKSNTQCVDYWSDAVRKLELEDPSFVKALHKVQDKASLQGQNLAESLLAETQKRREKLIDRRLKMTIGGREHVIREKFDGIIKSVQAFKDLVSATASLDPMHAGLPWAGVCLIMQVALSDSEQYAQMVTGVEEITAIISRYKHVEVICTNRIEVKFKSEFETLLIAMYKNILRYQVSAACYYQKSATIRFLRSIPKLDDVQDVLSEIRSCDARCTALGQVFDTRDMQLRHLEILEVHRMHNENLKQVSEILERLSLPQPPVIQRPVEIPFAFDRDPKFTAREDILGLLTNGFETSRRMALVGWAGIGKSQIAIEYAHRLHNEDSLLKIFWIRGARQDLFLKSYKDLARKINLTGWNDPEADIGELFRDWLCDSGNGSWLMVVDNVDDESVFLESNFQRYLPQVSHGYLLITSRNKAAARDLVNEDECILFVDRLSEEESLTLLRKKLPKDSSPEQDARRLVQLLENLPLAITQAAAYISKGSTIRSITRYLNILESDQVRMLEYTANDIRRDSEGRERDFSNSVLKIWSISFEYIKKRHPDAAENLCFMSLVFGQGIPMEYLLCGDKVDLNEVEEGLGPLLEFSLIDQESNGSIFSIHRLVQLSVQSWLKKMQEMEKNTSIAVKALWSRFPEVSRKENWRKGELLMPHVDVVLNYEYSSLEALEYKSLLLSDTASYFYSKGKWAEALKRASRAYELSTQHFHVEDGLHRAYSLARLRLAEAHECSGHYEEAKRLAHSLVVDSTKFLGDQDSRTMDALELLGRVLSSAGLYSQSEHAHRKALVLREEKFGKESPFTINALAGVALALNQQFKLEEALIAYQELLDKSKRIMGDNQSIVLLHAHNYGHLLTSMGRYQEAEAVIYDTYLKREKMYTENHPFTLMTLGNYALVLALQHKSTEAKRWNDHALLLMMRNGIDEANPLVTRLLHNKSFIEQQLGNLPQARDDLNKALTLKMEHEGDKHPETLVTMQILGGYETALRNYSRAEDLLTLAFQTLNSVLGSNHVYSLLAAVSLAFLRRKRGRYGDSLILLREALPTIQRTYGADHWDSIQTQVAMAQTLCEVDGYRESAALMNTLWRTTEVRYGKMSWQSLDTQHVYAMMLSETYSTYDEAILNFEQVISGYKLRYLDETYFDLVLARTQLSKLLCKRHRLDEAERLARENVAICRRKLGTNSEITAGALKGLAHVLNQYQYKIESVGPEEHSNHETRQKESLDLWQEIRQAYCQVHGPNTVQALAAGFDAAAVLQGQKQYVYALEVSEKVMNLRKEHLGPKNPDYLESCHQTAQLLRQLDRFADAKLLNRETVELRASVLGEDSEGVMDSKNDLALCMRGLQEPEEALKVDLELLGRKQKLYGHESIKTLLTLNNLAMDYFQLENYEEAQRLLEQVLHGRSDKLGPDHPDTMLSLQNFGEVLEKLGRWHEAEDIFQRVLETRNNKLDLSEDTVDYTLDHLETCLRQQGKSKEAAQAAKRQMELREQVLGKMHPKTIASMRTTAIAFHLAKNILEAESVYRRYFDLRRKIPENVIKNLESLQSFGFVLKSASKIPEALRVSRKVFKGREVLLGIDNKEAIFSGMILVFNLHEQAKYDEAETLGHSLIARCESSIGKYDLRTMRLMHCLALIFSSQRRFDDCRVQLERTLQRLDESKHSELLLVVLQDLANICHSLNRLLEGQAYVARLLEKQKQQFGASSAQVATSTRMLGALLFAAGNFSAAERAFNDIIEINKLSPETSLEDHLADESRLSEILFRQDKRAEAEPYFLKALAIDQSIPLPRNHPYTLHNQARLARLLTFANRYEEAEAIALAVVAEGKKRLLPPSHIAVLASKRQIARIMALTGRHKEALEAMRVTFYADVELRGKRNRGTFETANDYGTALQMAGKYGRAMNIFRTALRFQEEELGERSYWTIRTRKDYVVFLCTAWKQGRSTLAKA